MGRVGAYLEVKRQGHAVRPARDAVEDFEDIVVPLSLEEQCEQAARCMNCGVAFCQSGVALGGSAHVVGCPLHNLIPETNDLLYRRRFEDAAERMMLTNPFPEFTGRVCPAPCEIACNLGLHREPVTINDNERALSDLMWEQGLDPLPQPNENAPLASVVGSGPAGLACAWELARTGWRVRVYEKSDRFGGLLMYGIPSMKLPKSIVDRRVDLMRESGIEFFSDTDAATCAHEIAATSDAVVLACGAGVPRDMAVAGRELAGVHFAGEYLTEVTASLLDGRECAIDAADKDVVVIGGGDTGTDCVALALRQGARSVTQVIRASRPPEFADAVLLWPAERPTDALGYGQREAACVLGSDPRRYGTDTVAFEGKSGAVTGVRVRPIAGGHTAKGPSGAQDAECAEEVIPAQLVLIAKGFTGADPAVFRAFGVSVPRRDDGSHYLGDALVRDGSISGCEVGENTGGCKIYAAGDGRSGSSLVVHAIADGLACAAEMNARRA